MSDEKCNNKTGTNCFSGADANDLECFMKGLVRRNPGEKEFHQAVHEVAADVVPFIAGQQRYQNALLLERMTEPDQIVSFRVCWLDDDGHTRANRAWRVQFNNATGPYKGGLRFDPDLTESVLKFLGFEQCFKNALTGLPIGGAKGGANFNPKGKSDDEVMRFCQALMSSMYHYIGEHRDIPAGDIGTGAREVGYLFGQYRRLTHQFVGALTGKGVAFGGSELRTEATGYGAIYFLRHVLDRLGGDLKGQRIAISGAGNVARYAAEKAVELGACVITLSDSKGFIHLDDGLKPEHLEPLHRLKEDGRSALEELADDIGATYHPDASPWGVECDIALPCAIQNELGDDDAASLIKNGCRIVAEGANMPCTADAIERFQAADQVVFAPGKAVNAGGVAVSGLERTQNAQHMAWQKNEVDDQLKRIMQAIHDRCVEHGRNGDKSSVNYRKGANIAGFLRLADAMLAQGVM
ncbi:MAG TPA: NADP-specific glutamate dehydrogenase [Wenzhouxiangellaceae bacterium]|nr:NADP-specific glutamate dehydrogenase [Wenzhouxiangellaceae bacterium]